MPTLDYVAASVAELSTRRLLKADGGRSAGLPPTQPRRSGRLLGLALVLVAALLAACGNGSASSSKPAASASGASGKAAPRVDVAYIASVHAHVLVTGSGLPLYVFAPDDHSRATCVGTCAKLWPPLLVPSGTEPVAGSGVSAKLLGTDPYPAGGRIATYNGWPLYTYATDRELGAGSHVAAGQGLDVNGGYWYVIRPDGSPMVQHVAPAS